VNTRKTVFIGVRHKGEGAFPFL